MTTNDELFTNLCSTEKLLQFGRRVLKKTFTQRREVIEILKENISNTIHCKKTGCALMCGTALKFKRQFYHHFALVIYVTNEHEVFLIHYSGEPADKNNAKVRIDLLEQVAAGCHYEVVTYQEVIREEKATSEVGETTFTSHSNCNDNSNIKNVDITEDGPGPLSGLKKFLRPEMETMNDDNATTVSKTDKLKIALKAISKLDEQDYSLWNNNCEHFVSGVLTDSATSEQISTVYRVGTFATLFAAGALIAGGLLSYFSKPNEEEEEQQQQQQAYRQKHKQHNKEREQDCDNVVRML